MELTAKLLLELQRRLKIGNRRGVHLNAIPANSRYKFDLKRLSHIDKDLPDDFINAILTQLPLKFRVSWKDNVPDLNSLFEEDQAQLVKISKAFENLINQTDAIESEKGINTFGFGFPILVRRDELDNKLTVAPILIWSLKIKRTKEFNTWEIQRNQEDPIYLNEVLINHLQSDSNVTIEQIPNEMLDDGIISKDELIDICVNLIKSINTFQPDDLRDIFKKKLESIVVIGDKPKYEKLPLNSTNSFIEFGGLFSIFEVQKQNIISDYSDLMELEGVKLALEDLEGHYFQPISSVETDPTQQSILHSLQDTRNILIQGPPGTGKSQTLTAILMNALENNKKTIVVCEKRTALEVLHNALIEKGLSYQCALIRDIVKDRKAVVDSVRYRIDNSEYKKYRYNYSKETLENNVKRAKDLIDSINKKHKEVGREFFGNENWTKIVGKLLKEQRGFDFEDNLDVDKKLFEYTSSELNKLLDITQKGESLYANYSKIESLSFINPLKLIGDNPFIVEQQLNEDFEGYSKELNKLHWFFEATKKDYYDFRKAEFSSQINNIKESIEKILLKEVDYKNLLLSSKENYLKYRNSEFLEQIRNSYEITNQIDLIFDRNKENLDLLNYNKINAFGYKFLSLFSKSKKQTIDDHNELHLYFEKLRVVSENSKDIGGIDFVGELESKKKSLKHYKHLIDRIRDDFENKVESEFDSLGVSELLEIKNDKSLFKKINLQLQKFEVDENLKAVLKQIKIDFKNCLNELESQFESLSNLIISCKDVDIKYSFDNSYMENKIEFSRILENLEKNHSEFDYKIESEFKELELINPEVDKPVLFDRSTKGYEFENLSKLRDVFESLVFKVLNDNWGSEKIKVNDFHSFIIGINSLIEKKNNYFNNESDCFTIEFKWFQFYNNLNHLEREIINKLKNRNEWRRVFLIHYLNSLLVSFASIHLPTDEVEHFELENALGQIEKEQLKFIKDYWFSKQIDFTRKFEETNSYNLSVENLYNKRSSHRFKRLSLRQIIQKNPDLFTTFFPIILTSPDVASNLFRGMNGYFDIVMFDEASQLRIEDNLPALLKGKQIVIAGDEHQMPPSNYFSKVFDGTIEDEEDVEEEEEFFVDKNDMLLSCESLLDFGSELNFQKKHLDFHYRSKHPYLIDFSNYAFYNQRLKPLPNNFDYIPIKYIQVNGTFSEHTNEVEAEMVLSIIDNNINRLPDGKYPTVGIATFNIAQRNLIKTKILERQKFTKYSKFNEKIQELEEDGMFIKNLENIQGDERDVIILSTTYGISKDGKFNSRFGPINHSKGYKLLNVIVTRAKYKIYVCSSIPEKVFMEYKEYLFTEGSNNRKGVLYAYLAYCKAISEGSNENRLAVLSALSENSTKSESLDSFRGENLESPFEEEVYQSLADRFGTEKLIPQLQFAGFRIDIVYDSKKVGVPKIAIECDGAKYHSSKEAYLYDRHRQRILENHGFVFHRIWSTNWWRNPKKEADKLISFIKEVETNWIVGVKSESILDFKHAFTDEFQEVQHFITVDSQNQIKKEKELVDTLIDEQMPQLESKKIEVDVDSKVQVKYVNNGKNICVQIVKSEINKNEVFNGVQKIFYKSPLAVSLLGRTEGDIVKIGDLDNYVEILEINN